MARQMRQTTENTVESYLEREVKARKGKCLKQNPNWYVGIPDRLVLLPGCNVFVAELKRPKRGQISKAQNKWKDDFNGMGVPHYFLNTKEKIDSVMEQYDLWLTGRSRHGRKHVSAKAKAALNLIRESLT